MHYPELDAAWQELTAPNAPFETQTIQVQGAPVRVFSKAPRTVRELWLSTAAFAERNYIVYENERLSYAQVHAGAAAVANWLGREGIKSGDRIAITMRNYPEWLIMYWGCVSVGVCVVALNAWWTSEETAYSLRDCRPKAVFCDGERLTRILKIPGCLGDARLVVTRAQPTLPGSIAWSDVLAVGGQMPDASIDPDQDACIFYTSGTTGVPKGARLTHRNCVTNIYNIMFGGQVQVLAHQRAQAHSTTPPPRAVLLIPTPFFHVTGSTCLAYSITLRGGTMVLMYKWDPAEALRLIERERITEVSGVPVMTREILAHPQFSDYDVSSLGSIAGGGASFQIDLIGKVAKQMPHVRARTGYGMTETSGSVTTVFGDFLNDKPTAVGRPLPGFDIRLVDEDGRDVKPGDVGELWVRGGAVFKGYLNAPEDTARTLTDGWLHTGDLARQDSDQFLYIVDRKKDMVIRGGENIYCVEVENCVQRHPAVAECCVFGFPDERLGEVVAIAIVLNEGATLSVEALQRHCADSLAKYKIPSKVWFLGQKLPRNATGKFVKREVREQLIAEHSSNGSTT